MKSAEEIDIESIEAIEPDIEIVIRVGAHEVAVFGLFANKPNEFDVVVGIDDSESRQAIVDIIAIARSAMETAAFQPVRTAGITQLSFLDTEG